VKRQPGPQPLICRAEPFGAKNRQYRAPKSPLPHSAGADRVEIFATVLESLVWGYPDSPEQYAVRLTAAIAHANVKAANGAAWARSAQCSRRGEGEGSHAERIQSTPLRARDRDGVAGGPRRLRSRRAPPTSSMTSTNLIRPPQFEHSRGLTSRARWYSAAQSMRDRLEKRTT
jgi:hypothetical protein